MGSVKKQNFLLISIRIQDKSLTFAPLTIRKGARVAEEARLESV